MKKRDERDEEERKEEERWSTTVNPDRGSFLSELVTDILGGFILRAFVWPFVHIYGNLAGGPFLIFVSLLMLIRDHRDPWNYGVFMLGAGFLGLGIYRYCRHRAKKNIP